MTLRPDPADPADANDAMKLTYDAWNRLVRIENDSTGDDIAVYEYDGLGRRIVKRLDTTANGTIDASDDARHVYYSSNWQVLEEAHDPGSGAGGAYDLDKRFIWGKRYIDDLIAREHDPDGDNTFTRHYALSDRQWNIVALAGDDGTIIERYRYTPYGQRTVMDQDFAVQTTGTSHDFWRGFQGLPHDEESGLVENRMRMLDVLLGRFMQVDPLGYPDGMNRYAAYHVLYGGMDPSGKLFLPVQLGACAAFACLLANRAYDEGLAKTCAGLEGKDLFVCVFKNLFDTSDLVDMMLCFYTDSLEEAVDCLSGQGFGALEDVAFWGSFIVCVGPKAQTLWAKLSPRLVASIIAKGGKPAAGTLAATLLGTAASGSTPENDSGTSGQNPEPEIIDGLYRPTPEQQQQQLEDELIPMTA